MTPLPVDPFIPRIRDALRRARAVVVTAEPGAGKTTRVPPALVADGPLILLQPRRAAARAVATRIAGEQGWTIGREIGWQIRFDSRLGASTALVVATEGVLTARLQTDPLASAFTTIVLDEFHERSLHVDLAIALAKQAWRARGDLRLVVMSATFDPSAVAAYLDGCPIVAVPGRVHPLDMRYQPSWSAADGVEAALAHASGDVLCFEPGAADIRRAIAEIERRVSSAVAVLPLHGSLDDAEQDRALAPGSGRRVIVATNIAETSVTVPNVTAVVDGGLHKVARYDAARGVDSLDTERITADSADQRAGRAGRTAPGFVIRRWDARDRLRPHREPEIARVDLAAAVLDVIAWGGDPELLEWFEAPPREAIAAARSLLARLGLVDGGRLTADGQRVHRLPLHPRLARMLLAADGAVEMARACALLSERAYLPPRAAATSSDLLSALDDWRAQPPHVRRSADEIVRSTAAAGIGPRRGGLTDEDFRRAVLAGYPDRVAQRREPGSTRVRLSSGAGAVITADSGVAGGEFLVALDVRAATPDARIRMASAVDREWLTATSSEVVHRVDDGVVRAWRVDRYDALVLGEHPAPRDPVAAARLLAAAWRERGPSDDDRRWLRRARFAGVAVDLPALVEAAAAQVDSVPAIAIRDALAYDARAAIDRDAPEQLALPSGRRAALDYDDEGGVSASVKLQELFGLAETPRIGPRREPVRFVLLAPNGRPVQITRDLRSFWDRTYPDVRKELRARYPKHPWPEDPWTATPTARTVRKRSG